MFADPFNRYQKMAITNFGTADKFIRGIAGVLITRLAGNVRSVAAEIWLPLPHRAAARYEDLVHHALTLEPAHIRPLVTVCEAMTSRTFKESLDIYEPLVRRSKQARCKSQRHIPVTC